MLPSFPGSRLVLERNREGETSALLSVLGGAGSRKTGLSEAN